MSAVLPIRWRARLRRVATLVTTVALIACSVGVPIPLAKTEKDTSQRYPCQECGCGCSSAEMCWQNCCCYTQQQKLAWAEKNGVTPPSFVMKEARLERLAALLESNSNDCCAERKIACCQQQKSCCSSESCDQTSEQPKKQDSDYDTVLTIRMLRCQGLGAHLVFAPNFLPVEITTATIELLPLETLAITNTSFISINSPPSTPPPQLS